MVVALDPLVGEVVLVELDGLVGEELLLGEGEQVGVGAALLLPPRVEVPGRRDAGREPLVVEAVERVVAVGQVGPAEAVLERLDGLEHLAVVGHEVGGWAFQSPAHQGVADEQLAGVVGVDAGVADGAVGDDGQAVEAHRLVDDRLPALGVPVGLGVGPGDEVGGDVLGPLRLDPRRGAGPEAGGLDQLGGHDPRRRLLGQRRAGEDREAGAAGAAELAGVAVAVADVGEQAGQQRSVDGVGVGVARCPGAGRARRPSAAAGCGRPATRGCAGS